MSQLLFTTLLLFLYAFSPVAFTPQTHSHFSKFAYFRHVTEASHNEKHAIDALSLLLYLQLPIRDDVCQDLRTTFLQMPLPDGTVEDSLRIPLTLISYSCKKTDLHDIHYMLILNDRMEEASVFWTDHVTNTRMRASIVEGFIKQDKHGDHTMITIVPTHVLFEEQ